MTTTTQQILQALGACTEAREHPHPIDPSDAWRKSRRGDWLLWLAARVGVGRRLIVRTAVSCVWPSLAHVPEGEERPRIALETALSWCDGGASADEVLFAADTAFHEHASPHLDDDREWAAAIAAAYPGYSAFGVSDEDVANTAAEAILSLPRPADGSADRVRDVIPWADVAYALRRKGFAL